VRGLRVESESMSESWDQCPRLRSRCDYRLISGDVGIEVGVPCSIKNQRLSFLVNPDTYRVSRRSRHG
jgi:hypothetical protein